MVDPSDTNGYWTVNTSSTSLIDTIWWTADVSPQDTLTRDLTDESRVLSIVAYVIVLAVPVTYPDSNLALLSAPSGWPATAKRCVPIPAVVVPNPTMFALTSRTFTLSFSHCNLIKSFSNLAVTIPTELLLKPDCVSIYDSVIVTFVPSKSTNISL